jgi:RNA processing factor Prp31
MYTTHAQPFQKTPMRRNRRVQQRRAAGMATRSSCLRKHESVECADGTPAVLEYSTDAERDEQIEALEKSNPDPKEEIANLKDRLGRAKEHGARMAKWATEATNERIKLEDEIRIDGPIRKKLKEDNELLLQHNKRLQELYEQKESQYNVLVVKSTNLADGVYATHHKQRLAGTNLHELRTSIETLADMADDVLRATMATRLMAKDTTPDMQRAPNNPDTGKGPAELLFERLTSGDQQAPADDY